MSVRPRILLAVADLSRITGGIAVLAKQVYRCLRAMEQEGEIELRVLVLNESEAEPGDDLPGRGASSRMRWCGGSKAAFLFGVLASRADLVVFDHAGPARAAALLPSWLRMPYCVYVHGVEIDGQRRPDYVRALRRATRLITNSRSTLRHVQALGPPLPPATVCWPGIDLPPERASPVQDPLLASLGRHALLIVGRLDAGQRHKGHDQLIDCLPRIVAQVPDVQLVIVGDGTDRARLEGKARSCGVEQSVLFAGHVDAGLLADLYERCAIFVMPSTGDGFGFVYLEAMARRRPCVGLAGGAAAEIIEEGVTGILVARDDPAGTAEALAGLLLDEGRRARMGAAGFARLNGHFLQRHFAARFAAIIREILAHGRAA